MNRWGKQADDSMIFYIGVEESAFLIPLVKNTAGQWYFNTKAGLQEIRSAASAGTKWRPYGFARRWPTPSRSTLTRLTMAIPSINTPSDLPELLGKQNGLYWKVVARR